jgi:hypothetical protein
MQYGRRSSPVCSASVRLGWRGHVEILLGLPNTHLAEVAQFGESLLSYFSKFPTHPLLSTRVRLLLGYLHLFICYQERLKRRGRAASKQWHDYQWAHYDLFGFLTHLRLANPTSRVWGK